MIEHWEIVPCPSEEGDKKHCLYLDGDIRDVGKVLSRLANFCGRPSEVPAPYTYSILMFEIEEEILRRVEESVHFVVEKIRTTREKKRQDIELYKSLQRPAPGFVPPARKKIVRKPNQPEPPKQPEWREFSPKWMAGAAVAPGADTVSPEAIPSDFENPLLPPVPAPPPIIPSSLPDAAADILEPSLASSVSDTAASVLGQENAPEVPPMDSAQIFDSLAATMVGGTTAIPDLNLEPAAELPQETVAGVEAVTLATNDSGPVPGIAQNQSEFSEIPSLEAEPVQSPEQPASSLIESVSASIEAAAPASGTFAEEQIKPVELADASFPQTDEVSVVEAQESVPSLSGVPELEIERFEAVPAEKDMSVTHASEQQEVSPVQENIQLSSPTDEMPFKVELSGPTTIEDSGTTAESVVDNFSPAAEQAQPVSPDLAIPEPSEKMQEQHVMPHIPDIAALAKTPVSENVEVSPPETAGAIVEPETSAQLSAPVSEPGQRAVEEAASQESPFDESAIVMPPSSGGKDFIIPIEAPINPVHNMTNLLPASNRFAYAAVLSVLETPATAYNPLFLHGLSGAGKSHFISALNYGFAAKFGQDRVFHTEGSRFAAGISRFAKEGTIDSFIASLSLYDVLLIDNFHLIFLPESEVPLVFKIIGHMVSAGKQVIISSNASPDRLPANLGAVFYEMHGVAVFELRNVTGETYQAVITRVVGEYGVTLSQADIEKYFVVPKMPLSEISRNIARVKVLEKFSAAGKTHSQLLEEVLGYDEPVDQDLPDADQAALVCERPKDFTPNAKKIGFFCQTGDSQYIAWVAANIRKRASELGMELEFEDIGMSEYRIGKLRDSASRISAESVKAGVKAAVIIGPAPSGVDYKVQADFFDSLRHLFSANMKPCGIVLREKMKSQAAYTRLVIDLLR